MFIQTEATPNPATLKFLPGRDVLLGEPRDFRSQEASSNSPLAQGLFAISGVTGVFLGCKRALAEMLPRGRGRIVNMASVAGLNGTGGGAAYIAAKHGVVGLTRQMAVTYSARGVTINAVCPGPILTNLRQHSQQILGPGTPDMAGRGIAVNDEQVRAVVPAGRRGTVEEIASAVRYLASDEAGYITGHSLVVDGGWRAK